MSLSCYSLLVVFFGIAAFTMSAIRRMASRAWHGEKKQIRGTLVPTEDPINDRFEIFFSDD